MGALPYLMRAVRIPEIWGTKLTLGLIQSKLDEHGLLNVAELKEIDPDQAPVQIGPFRAEFVRMAHSVPDCVAIMLETAAGRILHTGDYKLDHTPVDGLRTDVGKLAELGNRGIDLLLGDSTNAERPGCHRLGAARRRGLPPHHPGPRGSHPDRLLRIERAPHAAGGERRRRSWPEGRRRRSLDAQEHEHLAQPRLPRRA